MIIDILKTIVFFFILMYLSINLLGYFVRGLFTIPELDKVKQAQTHDFMKREVEKYQNTDKWITFFSFVLSLVYFFCLIYFWNIGVLIASIIIMIGRLPDLLWEIEHGRMTSPELMKKNTLYYISAFLPWLAFPILYYSLYVLR